MIVSVQLLKEFDHKKLKSTKKEGLDLGEEDDKKKPEEPKSEFEPLTKLMKDVFGDKVEKATASGRILASPCFLTWEYGWSAVDPTHSIMIELKRKASAEKSHKMVKEDLVFDTTVLKWDFNLNEARQTAGRIHGHIKLGLSMDHDNNLGDDDDLPRRRSWRAPPTRQGRWRKSIEAKVEEIRTSSNVCAYQGCLCTQQPDARKRRIGICTQQWTRTSAGANSPSPIDQQEAHTLWRACC